MLFIEKFFPSSGQDNEDVGERSDHALLSAGTLVIIFSVLMTSLQRKVHIKGVRVSTTVPSSVPSSISEV